MTVRSTTKAPTLFTRTLIQSPISRLKKVMYVLTWFAFSLLFIGRASRISAQTCYFPDGSQSYRDTPCGPSSANQASACCAYLDVCLNNGLCLSQGGSEVVSRGSCTDGSWQSGDCPQYCQDGRFAARIPRFYAPVCFMYGLR